MADTFTAYLRGITFAPNKSLLSVFNAGASAVLRVSRIFVLNSQTAAVSGVVTNLEIRRITASTGGTAVTPTKHNPSGTALDANVTVATGATETYGDLLRHFLWSTDEPAINALTIDEIETLPVWGCVWDVGYADTSVPKMPLRQNQGVAIIQPGSNIVGLCDIRIEFTQAAS